MREMTPERWAQIKEVFPEVVEAPRAERDGLVAAACHGDAELELELRQLLAEHDSTEGILEHPCSPLKFIRTSSAAAPPSLQPGQMLCDRFRIKRFLARGGMGEVFEAYDSVLGETVALKTIRSEIASDPRVVNQFKHEVRRARSIASPSVCRVYDLFTHPLDSGGELVFLTMQLLEGESLSDRLKRGQIKPAEALPLIRQMGEGLEAAHQAGIIHRDFKSGNVMLVPQRDGGIRAMITDFGLAAPAQNGGDSIAGSLTGGGTPAYMAPEQAQGLEVGPAADIYALGVVAYEMVAGRRPFDSATPVAITVQRPHERPTPLRSVVPDVDLKWESAILRCLERDPSNRFTKATDLANSIDGLAVPKPAPRRIGPVYWAIAALLVLLLSIGGYFLATHRRSVPPGNTIAVLPFKSAADDPQMDYYSDGFTEEMIFALTQIRDLRVIARESSFRYKGSTLPLAEVGRQLGVAKIVTGSVRREAGQLRVIARLVNASDGFQIWSQAYDGDEKQLFEIQNKIARAIAGASQVNLAQLQSETGAITPNLEAHDLYLMGRFHLNKRTDEGLRRALEYFQKAVAKDPRYALAYVGVADTYAVMAERQSVPPLDALIKAEEAARTAVRLDNRLADAYSSLGHITSLYERDFGRAERYFLQALDLNPALLTAHQWYSYMLLKLRRFDESLYQARIALKVDPLSIPANNNLAVLYFYMRADEETVAQCRKLLELDVHHFFAHMMIAQILARQGHAKEAFEEFAKNVDYPRDHPLMLRNWGEISAITGNRRQAEEAIRTLIDKKPAGGVPASYIAIVYAALGDKDQAFQWLESAYAERDGFLSLLQAYPAYDSLRSDPRYLSLLERLGLRENKGSGSARIH